MKSYWKKTISILIGVLLVFSLFPVSAFAGFNDGSMTIIYGDSAEDAGITLYVNNWGASYYEEKGGHSFKQTFKLDESGEDVYDNMFVFFNKVEGYDFLGWKIKDENGNSSFVTEDYQVLGVGTDQVADMECFVFLYNDDMVDGVTWSQIVVGLPIAIDGNWTIEPIFEKVGGSGSTTSYEFTLSNPDNKTTVEKDEDLTLEMYIDRGDYNAFSAVVTYDSDLFTYKSSSLPVSSVDSATAGTLKLSATGLNGNGDAAAATITFTAKAVNEAKEGAFTITSAKATTSEAAIGGNAVEASKGEPVIVTVNAVTTYTVTYPNGTTELVASGDDVTFTLSEKYADYEADGFTYAVTAGDFTVDDNNDGTYTIKNVTGDVTVAVTKSFAGTLTAYDLSVGSTTYKVAKITGTASDGKTFFYDGIPMIKSGDAYLYIIGTSGNVDRSKITVAAGEATVMAATGDVNQTGKIDINDAQLVSDLYNGKYADFETVSMVKFLAADVNGDGAVDTVDIAAVISNTEFVY